MIDQAVMFLDGFGVVVFATTGSLAAARKRTDLFGFILLGKATGICQSRLFRTNKWRPWCRVRTVRCWKRLAVSCLSRTALLGKVCLVSVGPLPPSESGGRKP
jgi:hypothetical protein